MGRTAHLPPRLPSEHGAWVMLALPIVFGLRVAGPRCAGAWLTAGAALLILIAEDAIAPPLRRLVAGKPVPRAKLTRGIIWGSAYLAVATTAFAGAAMLAPETTRGGLLSVAVGAALLGTVFGLGALTGRRRAVSFELAGMGGFATVAPMMGLACGVGEVSSLAAPACLAFAYSASALAYVRAYRARSGSLRHAAGWCLTAHVVLLLLVDLGLRMASAERRLLLVLAPAYVRTLWGLARPPATLRRLGLTELVVAVAVASLGVAMLH